MLISKAVEGTNPNYDWEKTKKGMKDPYNQNCQRCVTVYIMRRLGFDVEAMPRPKNGEPNQVVTGLESFKTEKGGDAFETQPMGKKKLREEMLQAPEGTLFLVSGKKPHDPEGHIWVAEKINNKLYFIDPQSGETDVEYYLSEFKDLRYSRADSFIFNSDPKFDWKGVVKGDIK